MVGWIAPSVLRQIPGAKEFLDGRDVVLLALWKSRCDLPYLGLIIWFPTAEKSQRIQLYKTVGLDILHSRYCVLNEPFDIDEAWE